jgi:hypothetical protein
MKNLTTQLFTAETVDTSVLDTPGVDVVHFSGVSDVAEDQKLVVRFAPNDQAIAPWIGAFTPGYRADFALSDVVQFEENSAACLVISSGQGFVVNVVDRKNWLALDRPFPITFAQYVDEHRFVVVADLASVTALTADRVVWAALNLGDGELIVDGVEQETVRGRGWNAPNQKLRRFVLDLATGTALAP